MLDRRQLRSKKYLKEAMIALLNEKEYTVITVTELVKRADLNRSTFYDHYESKDDLFSEIIEDIMDGIKQALYEPFQHGTQSVIIHSTHPSFLNLFNYIYTNDNYFLAILSSNLSSDFIKGIHKLLIEHGHNNLIYHFKPGSEIDVDLYIQYGMTSVLGVIEYWIRDGFRYTPQKLSVEISKIISNPPERVSFNFATNERGNR